MEARRCARHHDSGIWSAVTTAASMFRQRHARLVHARVWYRCLIQLGEVVSGVGSGLYGIWPLRSRVFIASDVGRTPSTWAKRSAYEMKMASLRCCCPALWRGGTAIAVECRRGRGGNPAPMGSRNSHAFFGRQTNGVLSQAERQHTLLQYALGIAMWLSRYWLMIPVLAIAGSLAANGRWRQRWHAADSHTDVCDRAGGTVLLVGALNFVPPLRWTIIEIYNVRS